MNKNNFKATKNLTIIAMLIALSYVGALIKIFNTVAFDSMPGYFAALYLGSWQGAIVISLGHMLTAMTSGFPLSLPIHILIAIMMAVGAFIFRLSYKKLNMYVAVLITTILNGPIFTLLFVPVFKWGFFTSMVIPLTIASLANIVLATLVYKGIKR